MALQRIIPSEKTKTDMHQNTKGNLSTWRKEFNTSGSLSLQHPRQWDSFALNTSSHYIRVVHKLSTLADSVRQYSTLSSSMIGMVHIDTQHAHESFLPLACTDIVMGNYSEPSLVFTQNNNVNICWYMTPTTCQTRVIRFLLDNRWKLFNETRVATTRMAAPCVQ